LIALIWRETALADLESIYAYIAKHNSAAANRLQDTIEACAERLPEHPYLYRPGRSEGTREAVVHPNYILIYRGGGNRQCRSFAAAIPVSRIDTA
jgi:toxin ParE1/3/4